MLVTQIFAVQVSADISDIRDLALQFNALNDQEKGIILKGIWDCVLPAVQDGSISATPQDIQNIYDRLKASVGPYWDNVVDEAANVPGKISAASVKLLISKIIANKGLIMPLYNQFAVLANSSEIKQILGLSSTATSGDVYAAIYSKRLPILKYTNNAFAPADNLGTNLVNSLNTTGTFTPALKEAAAMVIDAQMILVAERLNANIPVYNIDPQEILSLLDMFGLLQTGASTPVPAYTAAAAAAATVVTAGTDNSITLTVKDSNGNIDTSFNGLKKVTVSGIEKAPDNSYGSFNGNSLTSSSKEEDVNFTGGTATVSLILNKATDQRISFSISGVATPATNTLNIKVNPGKAVSMVIEQQPLQPSVYGGVLLQQPRVALIDRFGNVCTNDNTTKVTAMKYDSGLWVLNGTTEVTVTNGIAIFTDLKAAAMSENVTAQISFSSAGIGSVISDEMKLPSPSGGSGGIIPPTPGTDVPGTTEPGETGEQDNDKLNNVLDEIKDVISGGTISNTEAVTKGLDALKQNIAANNEKTTAENIKASTDIILSVTEAMTKVTDAQEKSKLINSILQTTEAIIAASTTVKDQENITTAIENVTSLLNNLSNIVKIAGDSSTVSSLVVTVNKALDAIDQNIGKISGEEASAKAIDSAANLMDSAAKLLQSLSDNSQKKYLGEAAAKIVDSVSKAVGNIKSPEQAASTAKLITSLIENTNKMVGNTNAEVAKAAAASTANLIKSTEKIVEAMSSDETLSDLTKDIISTTVSFAANGYVDEADRAKMKEAAATVAEKTINKLTTRKVDVSVDNGTANAEIDEDEAELLVKKAELIAQTADAVKDNAEGLGLNIEKKLVLDVEADSEVDSVKSSIPGKIFNAAISNGLTSVEIASDVATLKMEPDFASEVKDASAVSIETKKVKLTPEQEASLSEEQRKIYTSSSVVYDFTAELTDKNGNKSTLSKFDKEISVSIPYELKAGEDPECITVLYLTDDGKVINMQGRYNKETGCVEFTTNHFSKYIIKNLVPSFTDMKGHWSEQYVNVLYSKGIVNGKDSVYTYKPEDNVTRAEFAKLLTTALGIYDENAVSPFSDVEKDKWYSSYIASAYKYGLISGYPNGNFGPNDLITREDMAVMLTNALTKVLKYEDDDFTAEVKFSDKSNISGYALNAVGMAVEYGLISGKPGNIFDPKGYTKRSEAAAVIKLLYDLKNK